MRETNESRGRVFLVGAGPGDPDLVTVRATRLIADCDIVVYDSLVPDELLATLPEGVERRYVGKRAGKHKCAQEDINAILVDLAKSGKRVVRLKGGDPFVFGRGAEEAQALAKHGIPFEIVPGVTSGVAAPAYVGIPCTDRNNASSVTFVTGHKAVGNGSAEVPWEWIGAVKNGTLVIYMGVSEIEQIADKLIAAGLSANTPSAAIERGTFPTQNVACAPLNQLARAVRDRGIRPPALFVIGQTVDMQESLGWLKDKPLLGSRILVTGPAVQAQALYRSLRDLGGEVLPFPTIDTETAHDTAGWEALERLRSKNRWLVFTGENAVRYFLNQWYELHTDLRALAAFKIAAMGDSTIRALQESRLTPDFVPSQPTAAALAKEMTEKLDLSDANVVRVRGNLGESIVAETLGNAGAQVVRLEVYRTVSLTWPDETKDKLKTHPPNIVLFTSGSAAAALDATLTVIERQAILGQAAIVSIGPAATQAIRSHGMTVTREVATSTIPGAIDELIEYWKCRQDQEKLAPTTSA